MSYMESCHPGPGHHHFLPGLFQISNCLEDVSQLPSFLLCTVISTRRPKGLFKMKQHHFKSLFKILQRLSISLRVKAGVLTRSYELEQMQPQVSAARFLPILSCTPHSTLTSLFLPNTRQTHSHHLSYPHVLHVFSLLPPNH